MILVNYFKEFIKTCFSLHSFEDSIFTHEDEIIISCFRHNITRTASLTNECAYLFIECKYLIDTDTSFITSVTTLFASFCSIEFISFLLCSNSFYSDILHHPFDNINLTWICFMSDTTVWTESANESLSKNYVQS